MLRSRTRILSPVAVCCKRTIEVGYILYLLNNNGKGSGLPQDCQDSRNFIFCALCTLHYMNFQLKFFFHSNMQVTRGQMDSLGCHFDWNRVSTMSTFNTVRDIQSLRKSALAHLITINGRSGFFCNSINMD